MKNMSDHSTHRSERVQREQKFHDKRFANPQERSRKVSRFYALSHSIKQQYINFLIGKSAFARVLEYGCGTGSSSFQLASLNTLKVVAIDISPIAIEQAHQRAVSENLSDKLSFMVMNAENLDFADDSFDIVCGSGILHHLQLDNALKSVNRVLSSNGYAIFIEPLGHNPFINIFRSLTPSIRSDDEHPLLTKDLNMLKKYFKSVDCHYFYFTALFASLFVGLPGCNHLLFALEKVDQQLFRIPFFQKQAWQVLIILSQPYDSSMA